MQSMSLSELKAENAKLEEVKEPEPIEEVETESIEEEPEAEPVEQEETAEVEEETEAEEAEQPAWMQTEEEEVERKYTGGDIGAAKRKLREKLERKHTSEVDKLKAEIEKLKTTGQPPAQPATNPKPKREDFYSADDPDEAYLDAMTDWKLSQMQAKQAQQASAQQAQQQQEAKQEAINKALDSHYEQAATMLKENGISEDLYAHAENEVINAVESVFPGAGQQVMAALISKIDGDSEKLMFHLGRNKAKLAEFQGKLREDPDGHRAAVYLGEVKSSFKLPNKRKSTAPAAAPQLKAGASQSSSEKALLRKYKEAHKKRDSQTAFNIKREAKKAGINTREW